MGTVGDPSGRYCANIGHKQDDESGLIYMRARYYDPTSGRFISEDPSMAGFNWYVYCGNNPTGFVDESGKDLENPADAVEDLLKGLQNSGVQVDPKLLQLAHAITDTIAYGEKLQVLAGVTYATAIVGLNGYLGGCYGKAIFFLMWDALLDIAWLLVASGGWSNVSESWDKYNAKD